MRVRVFPDAKELQHGVKRMRPSIEGTLGVTMSPLEGIPGWAGWTIDVGEDTRVHHLWPSDGLEKEDQLFQEYQGAEAGKLFKRNTLSTHRRKFDHPALLASAEVTSLFSRSPRILPLLSVLLQHGAGLQPCGQRRDLPLRPSYRHVGRFNLKFQQRRGRLLPFSDPRSASLASSFIHR